MFIQVMELMTWLSFDLRYNKAYFSYIYSIFHGWSFYASMLSTLNEDNFS